FGVYMVFGRSALLEASLERALPRYKVQRTPIEEDTREEDEEAGSEGGSTTGTSENEEEEEEGEHTDGGAGQVDVDSREGKTEEGGDGERSQTGVKEGGASREGRFNETDRQAMKRELTRRVREARKAKKEGMSREAYLQLKRQARKSRIVENA